MKKLVPKFSRADVPRLYGAPGPKQNEFVISELLKNSFGFGELIIDPFAWLSCFEETVGRSPSEIIQMILGRVREREAELTKEHGLENKVFKTW